jgi:hypothetical protein
VTPDNQNLPHDRVSGWLAAIKGLTLTNAVVIVMLVVVAAPAYVLYRALNDPAVLDRFMSSYREYPPSPSGCTIREVKMRGGTRAWGLSAGFAFQGTDRWAVNVVLDHAPTDAETESYCASLKLLIDSWMNIVEAAP